MRSQIVETSKVSCSHSILQGRGSPPWCLGRRLCLPHRRRRQPQRRQRRTIHSADRWHRTIQARGISTQRSSTSVAGVHRVNPSSPAAAEGAAAKRSRHHSPSRAIHSGPQSSGFESAHAVPDSTAVGGSPTTSPTFGPSDPVNAGDDDDAGDRDDDAGEDEQQEEKKPDPQAVYDHYLRHAEWPYHARRFQQSSTWTTREDHNYQGSGRRFCAGMAAGIVSPPCEGSLGHMLLSCAGAARIVPDGQLDERRRSQFMQPLRKTVTPDTRNQLDLYADTLERLVPNAGFFHTSVRAHTQALGSFAYLAQKVDDLGARVQAMQRHTNRSSARCHTFRMQVQRHTNRSPPRCHNIRSHRACRL
jgi:hypothetical protein